MLEKFFKLKMHQTCIRTEILAGVSTFLSMAYILFVNPSILGQAGMDEGAVFVATCLTAAIGTAVMGIATNYPIALAPGMGLNTFFTYTVVLNLGYSWNIALGAVFISAVLFLLLSLFRLRRWIIFSIPEPLRGAIAAGVGLFLALIALNNSGIITSNKATLVTLGDLSQPKVILSSLGFAAVIALQSLRVYGAALIVILSITVISVLTGISEFGGLISTPPSIAPTLLELDIKGAMDIGLVSVIFSFLFVEIFDNSGIFISITERLKSIEKNRSEHRVGGAFIADSTAAISGALLGTSTTTSYIESASGVSAGGRTGLTSLTVSLMFLLALFFAPLAASVPLFATTPALMLVSVLMMGSLSKIEWDDLTTTAPVLITTLSMPFTYSISNGIAFGCISWTAIKLMSGRFHQLNLPLVVLSILFLLKFRWISL